MRNTVLRYRQRIARRLDPLSLELLYQQSYFQLARQVDWLASPPLSSPGGGTASFSQLYVLLSLLNSERFDAVLELGVGQSTNIITSYVHHHGDTRSVHIDEDKAWLAASVPEAPRVLSVFAPLQETDARGKHITWYQCGRPEGRFDLLLVDGPTAWTRASRYNRWGVLDWVPQVLDDEFVILIDDTSRSGERALVSVLEPVLHDLNSTVQRRDITGANSQTLFATEAHKSALYL